MQSSPSPSAIDRAPAPSEPGAPWWRFGIVWLALGGPAVVVAASVATFAIAARHADTVVVESPPPAAHGLPSDAAARLGTTPTAPALQGRNHAATPRP